MTPPVIRLLIIDDHALFREGLARLLGAEPGLQVVAQCSTAAEALRALSSAEVDVVLLDVDLGDERGVDFLARSRGDGFTAPVLVVTAGMSDAEARELVARGAAGIFLKQDSAARLAEGIRAVAEGRAWIDQRWLAALVAPTPASGAFTTRELDVLRAVLDGLANKEIAARLNSTESAIKAVLQQLFHKTGVRSRSQLVRIALERHGSDL